VQYDSPKRAFSMPGCGSACRLWGLARHGFLGRSFRSAQQMRAAPPSFRTASEIASASAAQHTRLPTTCLPILRQDSDIAASAPPRHFRMTERAAVVAIMAIHQRASIEDAALYVGFFQEIGVFRYFHWPTMVLDIKFGGQSVKNSEVRS